MAAALAAPVDLNGATVQELQELRGIGPSKAASIVAWREARGPCAKPEEVIDAPGIGPGTWEAIRRDVRCGETVAADGGLVLHPPPPIRAPEPVNINRATAAELLALAGMTPERAGKLVSDRDARGTYASCRDVVRIDGFGPATVAVWGDRCTTEEPAEAPPPATPAPEEG